MQCTYCGRYGDGTMPADHYIRPDDTWTCPAALDALKDAINTRVADLWANQH